MGFLFVPLGIGFIRLLAAMPPALGVAMGRLLGTLLFYTARGRRLVCERNISVSFPELTPSEQKKLVKECFIQNGVGLTETAWSWHRPIGFIDDKVVVSGQELLHAARKNQTGILLLCPHYSMLDLVAPLLHAVAGRFVISYRPNDNPTFDQAVRRGRTRYAELVDVRALREIVKRLKQGDIVWFGPDQDMGPRVPSSPLFWSFSMHRNDPIAVSEDFGAVSIFLDLHRDIKGVYHLSFVAMPDNYPCDDEVENACQLNQCIEKTLRKHPSQYMWMHKRFKTNPDLTKQTLYQSD